MADTISRRESSLLRVWWELGSGGPALGSLSVGLRPAATRRFPRALVTETLPGVKVLDPGGPRTWERLRLCSLPPMSVWLMAVPARGRP